MSDSENLVPPGAKIKVIGIGGGGGNAVNTMIRTGIEGVEFITANTDVQSLRFSLAERKIQIGKELTRGLGAGADPDIGRDAMLEDRHAISEAISGSNMVFITAGMGGGTGTGGAAIAAQIAREQGALTVAVVTKPFSFEGKRRLKYAEEGIRRLEECVDTLITIPNQRLLEVSSPELSMIDAFRMADNVLVNAVKGISDIINVPGNLNVDFADVKTVMSCMGQALMGIGIGEGPNRAKEAAQRAISSPLLEDVSIEGATGILINITASETLGIREVHEACSLIQEAAHEDANIIFGTVIDESVGDQIRVTVIATGFPSLDRDARQASNLYKNKRPIVAAKPSYPAQPSYPSQSMRPHQSAERSFRTEVASAPMPHREDRTGFEENLAKLTMNGIGQQAAPAAPSAPAYNPQQTPVQPGSHLAQDLSPSRERIGASVGASLHDDEDLAAIAPAHAAETDKQFAGNASDEMDRKIDEALKIAEQLSKSPTQGEDDDLDIPSFLRKSNKDLSLS
ncbi:MAG: cell division protein FtsZ [Proteobacteria bacterium]|nr:MAG: cell division protein FtsZ [Pseudomonadota bacterium]